MSKKLSSPFDSIWVGRTEAGIMHWVFDPEIPHPDRNWVYGFAIHAGKMREYETKVTLLVEEGKARDEAIGQYLKWKETYSKDFLREMESRRERDAAKIRAKAEADADARAHKEEEASAARARAAQEAERRRWNHVRALTSEMSTRQDRDVLPIRSLIEEREIEFLAHFTRIENLPGIVERGITPRAMLTEAFVYNDEMRLDGFPESSSFSVSFPNYLMLYRYRCINPGGNWAVLTVSTDTLIDVPCLFFPTNAANGRFRDGGPQMPVTRMGFAGLASMFHEEQPGLREERGLPARLTTDPQAEVLAFGVVGPERIRSVSLFRPDPDAEVMLRARLPGVRILIGGKMFEPRADYQYWQAAKRSAADAADDLDNCPF